MFYSRSEKPHSDEKWKASQHGNRVIWLWGWKQTFSVISSIVQKEKQKRKNLHTAGCWGVRWVNTTPPDLTSRTLTPYLVEVLSGGNLQSLLLKLKPHRTYLATGTTANEAINCCSSKNINSIFKIKRTDVLVSFPLTYMNLIKGTVHHLLWNNLSVCKWSHWFGKIWCKLFFKVKASQ